MAAGIWGDRVMSREKPMWHELGTVFSKKLKAVTAVKKSGCDYKVTLQPLGVDMGGFMIPAPGMAAIMREPTPDDDQYRIFGTVAEDYGLIDNLWLAEQLDKLTGEWPVETIGALHHGKTFFMSLNAGSAAVAGEEITQYFVVSDTKDGRNSLQIAFTPVRVVCQNTLTAGLKQATISGAIAHRKTIHSEVELKTDLFAQMQQAQHRVLESFEAMAGIILEDGDVAEIFEATYPYPRKPKNVKVLDTLRELDNAEEYQELIDKYTSVDAAWQAEFERMDNFRNGAWEVLDRMNQENGKLANSVWYAYNALVEVEDYRKGPEATTPASILFGSRARTKRRAWAAAMEYVN